MLIISLLITKIQDFFEKYPDEASCKTHFKPERDKQEVVCKRCQGKEHYWLSTRDHNTNVDPVNPGLPYVTGHCYISPSYLTIIGILG